MSQNIGKVVEIIGPVVDIQFSQNSLLSIYTWYGCAKYSV